jgi:hypothetical protein
MIQRFLEMLTQNAPDVLTFALIGGITAVVILYIRARMRHVRRLRQQINGAVPMADSLREALARLLNLDTTEAAVIGTVTFVDVAWHYSMADPHIWDHFQGPAAAHMLDAVQNLEVLRASLGTQANVIAGHILHYFQSLEATQVFHDLSQALTAAEHAGTAASAVLDAPGASLVGALEKVGKAGVEAKIGAAASSSDAGLISHVPLVTLGFATYRAWRRGQQGAGMARNLEFAAIEVTTRAGGGLVGSQIGGAVGTAIAPGVGTIIGSIAGAVAGALGGALLGEEIKGRHIKAAKDRYDAALAELGQLYLDHPGRFRELTEVFTKQEQEYRRNLQSLQWRFFLHCLMLWRLIWPDQKLILLEETVRMARERLDGIRRGTLEAIDQLTYMQARKQHRELGLILWGDTALRDELKADPVLIGAVQKTYDQLRHESVQLGNKQSASA